MLLPALAKEKAQTAELPCQHPPVDAGVDDVPGRLSGQTSQQPRHQGDASQAPKLGEQVSDLAIGMSSRPSAMAVVSQICLPQITLKIYNGVDSKFHRYEDAWVLLEK